MKKLIKSIAFLLIILSISGCTSNLPGTPGHTHVTTAPSISDTHESEPPQAQNAHSPEASLSDTAPPASDVSPYGVSGTPTETSLPTMPPQHTQGTQPAGTAANSTSHGNTTTSTTSATNTSSASVAVTPANATTAVSVQQPIPNPPRIILPTASGINVSTTDSSAIDYSNTSQGYIMLQYTGGRQRLILRITAPNGTLYQFQPNPNSLGSFQSFPLSEGSGNYTIELFEGAAGTTVVSPVDRIEFHANINNGHMPFLMPNYVVNYNGASAVVTKASELSAGKSELEKVSAVYNWFVENISYDDHRALTVQPGYAPNLTELMRDKRGICSDFTSGMAAMLRSQGIPTRFVEGWAGSVYHAWVSVYTVESGWVNTWIRFNGSSWTRMEPTFAAVNGDGNSGFQAFVLNSGNYIAHFYY